MDGYCGYGIWEACEQVDTLAGTGGEIALGLIVGGAVLILTGFGLTDWWGRRH